MQMTLETSIAAPPEAVFAVVADVPAWSKRIAAIQSIEMLTPGAVAAGTRFRETRLMLGRVATEEMTVAEIAPPERFVLTAANHGTDYRMTHLLTPVGTGTRLTLVFEGRPQTVVARLLAPIGLLMAGTVRKAMQQDLADLKRSIETASTNG